MPGIAYYLSRWYRRSELAFRLGLYMTMAPLSGAFGGLLASGILKLSHFGSLHRWEMYVNILVLHYMNLSLANNDVGSSRLKGSSPLLSHS